MSGLDLTDEQRSAEVAALVRELKSYEARVIAGDERFEGRVALVRAQLEARGALAKAPAKRSERRGGQGTTPATQRAQR